MTIEKQIEAMRGVTTPVLFAETVRRLGDNIACGESDLNKLAADAWDAAEIAHDRAELAKLPFTSPTGNLPEMQT